MPDNPTTDNPPLDHEDWQIALAPYKGNPGAALTLGFHFMVCEHEWIPREINEDPRVCPKCKSPYWNKPRRTEKKRAA